MLEEEFLKPLGLTKYCLAKDIGVPPQRIGDIVAGKRGITANTDLRLCRYFGLSEGWWLRGQASYDIAMVKEDLREELNRIPRCALLAAQGPGQPRRGVPGGTARTGGRLDATRAVSPALPPEIPLSQGARSRTRLPQEHLPPQVPLQHAQEGRPVGIVAGGPVWMGCSTANSRVNVTIQGMPRARRVRWANRCVSA